MSRPPLPVPGAAPAGGPIPLADRVIIVTGASSGIGAAAARRLALAGAKLVLTARSARGLADTAAAVTAEGAQVVSLPADLSESAAAATEVAALAADTFGRVDGLVHAAGTFDVAMFGQAPLASLDAQYRLHVRVPAAMTAAALPHMPSGSAIVFIGSNLASYGVPGTAFYAASKGAVEAMARTLAVELGPRGIRVNVVAPGVTRTAMTSRLTGDPVRLAEIEAAIPLRKVADPGDIAAAVVYLLSPDSGHVTGVQLQVDGGASIA